MIIYQILVLKSELLTEMLFVNKEVPFFGVQQ